MHRDHQREEQSESNRIRLLSRGSSSSILNNRSASLGASMLTASMFDDPVRERGRLGSNIASMGDGMGKPTERVANPCLVTDAAEPNAILRMRDDDTRALENRGRSNPVSRGDLSFKAVREMTDLSRSDLILTIMADNKMCDCGRGTRIQFAYGRYLKWRRCHRCLTRTSPLWIVPEKILYALWQMEAEAGGLTD